MVTRKPLIAKNKHAPEPMFMRLPRSFADTLPPLGLTQINPRQQRPELLRHDLAAAFLSSPNGIAYIPSSSRLAHAANPPRSQYRILTLSRRRLAEDKKMSGESIRL